MGFTTGFTGGVTLTLGIAYLTVLAHERNRKAQAHQLRAQSSVLTSLLEPAPLLPPQSRAELAREERGTLVETAKGRWNDEVENAVRWVQRTDWDEVRERLEGAVSRLLNSQAAGKASDETVAAVGVAKDNVAQALASTKEGTSRIAEAARLKAEEAAAIAHEKKMTAELKAADLRDATSRKVSRAGAEAKSGAHEVADSIRNSGGTIDAARGAVRDAISKGVEKGKEVIGKAQAAIGVAEEEVESTLRPVTSESSAVEKALRERYEKPNDLEKSVEQALAERYVPVDARDNTHLKGI